MRQSDLLVGFLAAAIAFLVAGVAAGLLARAGMLDNCRRLALQLAFLGGVSQLVLGAGRFFVAAVLATDPPSRPLVRAQLVTWNVGTALVVVGVPTDRRAAT